MRAKIILTILMVGLLGLIANAANLTFGGSPSGYMNVFELDGATPVFDSVWGVEDLQTLTSDNITFELYPNYSGYADNVGSTNPVDVAFWTDSTDGGATPGDDGGKVMEAVTYFELDHRLTPDLTTAVFNYTVDIGSSLDTTRYTSTGFIQVIDTNGNAVVEVVAANTTLGPVGLSLDLTTSNYTGYVLQAGWRIKGQNANPADADDHGKMIVTVANLHAVSTDVFPPTPVAFDDLPAALSSTQMIMSAQTAVDNYTVEYQFSNTTTGVSSDWQTNQVWVDSGAKIPDTYTPAELITDQTYLDLDGSWEGYADGGAVVPSTFVTASSGVATVTPGSASEYNFFTTVSGLNLGQAYTFSIVADNDTTEGTSSAVAFVKAFDAGWGWIGGEFKSQALTMDGSATTINFTPVAGAHYQVGTFTIGTTNGSYDVSSPSLFTTNIIDNGYTGLIPDTQYVYTVRARDLSPQTNVSAWATPVEGTSTVFDVTPPSPEKMSFSTPPTAIGETAISMIATLAVDTEADGVEYLFTNVTTGGTSGWQSSREWTDAGNLEVPLMNTNNWAFDDNTDQGWGAPSDASVTNISGSDYVYLWVDSTGDVIPPTGGFSVGYHVTNVTLAGTGFIPGNQINASSDIKALAGMNGGGAGLKFEFYGPDGSMISDDEKVLIGVTEDWATYTVSSTIPANTVEVKIVLLVTVGWDGANPFESHYLFDNIILGKGAELTLVPGTEYTYRVKARDTSPVKNETDWSDPVSVTTQGTATVEPLVPFSVGAGVDGGNMVLSWDAIRGHSYDVLYKTNLVTDLVWMTYETIEATADGPLSATNAVDGEAGFFRIQGR